MLNFIYFFFVWLLILCKHLVALQCEQSTALKWPASTKRDVMSRTVFTARNIDPTSASAELRGVSHFSDIKIWWNAPWPGRLRSHCIIHWICSRSRTTYQRGLGSDFKKIDLCCSNKKIRNGSHVSKKSDSGHLQCERIACVYIPGLIVAEQKKPLYMWQY